MANKLSWMIEVFGLDKLQNLETKLRDLDKLSSTGGKVSIASPMAAGPGGGGLSVGGQKISSSIVRDMENAARVHGYANLQQAFRTDPKTYAGILTNLHPSLKFSPDEVKNAVFGSSSSAVPPVIGSMAGKQGPVSKQLTALFTRLAGTGISNIPGFSALGGMWTARPIVALISMLSGLPLAVIAAGFAAISGAVVGVVYALHEFSKSVKEGAKLYDQAAKSGMSMRGRARLNQIAGVTGISEEQLEKLALGGEFAHGTRFSIDSMILAARGTGSGGVAQQLMNEKWAATWRDAQPALRADANIMGDMAKQMKEIEVLGSAIGQHFRTLRLTFTGMVSGEVKGLLTILNGIANVWGRISEIEPKWLKDARHFTSSFAMLGWTGVALRSVGKLFGPSATDPKQYPWLGMEPYRPQANRWERLGFVTSPFAKGDDYQRETAQNTKKIADAVSNNMQVSDRLSFIARRHSLNMWANDPNANLP